MYQDRAQGVSRYRFRRLARAERAGAVPGFTLVELMVTLAVAAVLIAIAVPSFKHIMISSRLNTTANSMVNALSVARMEAIKRNAGTQFCGITDVGSGDLHDACGTDKPGAVVTRVGVAGAATVQAAPVLNVTSLHIKTANAIRFNAQGLGSQAGATGPYQGTVAVICSSGISSKNIRTIKMTAGSILETATSGGDCP